MKKTTVVIPNLNGERYIRKCLKSIDRLRYDIVVVDNGSKDRSCDIIRKEFPYVRLLENERNLGFCSAVNAGVREADTEYVFLLNNDAFLSPDCIGKLERFMDGKSDAFSCQARIMSALHPEVIDDDGDLYSVMGWAFCPSKGKTADRGEGMIKGAEKVFSCCACAALYRKDVWDRLGGMDERHFAYLEDVDTGWRANKEGYGNYCLNSATAWHLGSASSGSRYNAFKAVQSARNSVFIIGKNMTPWQKALNFVPFAAGFAVKTCFYAKYGLWMEYLSGLFKGLILLSRCDRTDVYFRAGEGMPPGNRLKTELGLESMMIKAAFRRFG